MYKGVDVDFYGTQEGLGFDFIVAPGADPRGIRLEYEGANRLDLDEVGNLVLHVPGGVVVQRAPIIYQVDAGARRVVPGRYEILDGPMVTFEVSAYDSSKPLVIDPTMLYATYLGGSEADGAYGIAVDRTGSAYVTGFTFSTNFPTRTRLQVGFGGASPTQITPNEGGDVFVTKINPSGSAIVYSTYLGGTGDDVGVVAAVDEDGNAYVTGYTRSEDFPVAGSPRPFQPTYAGGGYDAFVSKLSPRGELLFSTYLGGGGNDLGRGLAVIGNSLLVSGSTSSSDLPLAGTPLQPVSGGGQDVFLARFDAATGARLTYLTYLGGSGEDFNRGVVVDAFGNVFLTGQTTSLNFPVTANAYQVVLRGFRNAFVVKISADGSRLLYSTYLGGSGDDRGRGIAVDASGNAYIGGDTTSGDFPLAGSPAPLQSQHAGGGRDVFMAKLNAAGSNLVYSTYLGGSNNDVARGMVVDASGNAYVTGMSTSIDFPTVRAVQTRPGGKYDIYVAQLNPRGSALVFSSYFGGAGDDLAIAIAIDRRGGLYVAGMTDTVVVNVPPVAYQTIYGGGISDALVFKLTP